ncbi:GDP-fucose protein O-fucosyltransferase 1-like [Ostrea edulis]|uniref:GDP-fucose protein O-fucosyltransferase 1-like n=1 Tax=Ostrea edulis TaxID=37623 RepID=UPI002095B9B3|nr:GDP-fucose protein O-fucosyltransferase 1-like [Ostrea edulis]XP_048776582.1 GDP-fucose protein O-fucosyltransferase 1-like [Ostrea edulis]
MLFAVVLLTLVPSAYLTTVDPKGYVVYCPCMGRFGNQADHFLGSLAFAKDIDRTLILPPWVEYNFPKPKSDQIPFDTYFRVEAVQKFHRAITMEKFMKDLAPKLWPKGNRTVFCYGKSYTGEPGCDAKHGNPFGPFWDTFNIDFDASEFYEPLSFDTSNQFEVKRWQERYPPERYPVLAFKGAPAHFPVEQRNLRLQQYLVWSEKMNKKAEDIISNKLGHNKYIGIHLRLGSDFSNACKHVDSGAALFASPQCVGYRGELGKLTSEMCYPSDETIIKQVKAAVKGKAINDVFIATDSRDLISKLKKAMPKVKFARQDGKSPHVDLAVLGKSDHFIGCCVSTFSAFVKRERDFAGKSSEFWAFRMPKRDEL